MMQASGYQATDGAAYDAFMGRWTARLAAAIVARVPFPPGPCLDVGCGTGSMVRALHDDDPQRPLVGVDISHAYLDVANAGDVGRTAEFLAMDAHALHLPDDRFAASVSIIALNFMADPAAALAEMARVTRAGGTVLGAVWDFRGGLVYQRLLWDTAAVIDPEAAAIRARLFSHPLAVPGGLEALWHAAGLRDVTCESVTVRMDFADFNDYWQPMLGGQGPVAGYVSALSGELRDKVSASVRAAFLSGDADGPRSLTATAWVVQGTVPTGN